MQFLKVINPTLGIAMAVIENKEKGKATAGLAQAQDMTKQALEKLETALDEAPVEKIFDQPNIEDAQILRKFTPEQVRRIESKMLSI
jgi:hypothetical protein